MQTLCIIATIYIFRTRYFVRIIWMEWPRKKSVKKIMIRAVKKPALFEPVVAKIITTFTASSPGLGFNHNF